MKKILPFLLLLLIGCDETSAVKENPAIWNGKADTKWYNKNETEFTITTPEQLAGLAKLVEGGNDFKDKTIKLGADIMLNDTTDWQNWASKPPKNKWKPIGIYIAGHNAPGFLHNHFTYYLIDALVPELIQRALRLAETDLPFSGVFDGNGFAVSGVYINTLENYQGLFGSISTAYNKKAELRNLGVRTSYIKGGAVVGGLVGYSSHGIVNGCYSTAWVAGIRKLGGLVGKNYGGYTADATIINSYSAGVVSGGSIVGGLTGMNDGGTISNSYSASKVSGKSTVGGLAGHNYGIISNSYFIGIVIGNSEAGGLVGANIGEITNSYSTGTVTGKNDAGGLVGKSLFWISGKEGIVKNGYYNIEANGQGKGAGSDTYGVTTAEMKKRETFKGWDFDSIWGVDSVANGGYPYLRNMQQKTE